MTKKTQLAENGCSALSIYTKILVFRRSIEQMPWQLTLLYAENVEGVI
jgi:hypothetical protein